MEKIQISKESVTVRGGVFKEVETHALKVAFGWIIQTVVILMIPSNSEHKITMSETFVTDPNHSWDPKSGK